MTSQSGNPAVASSPSKWSWLYSWPVVVLLFLALDAGIYAYRHELIKLLAPTAAVEQPQAARPRVRRAVPADMPVTTERIEQIRKLIVYHPRKGAHGGWQTVNVLVTLDDKGGVDSLEVLDGRFDPVFAKAVQKAIRASGAFPAQSTKMFTLTFTDDGF